MKTKFLLVVMLLVAITCYSKEKSKQPKFDPDLAHNGPLKIELGYAFNNSSLLYFNKFATSYNGYFAEHLTDTLGRLNFGQSPYLAVGFGNKYFTFQVNYTRYKSHTSSTFSSGEGREYDMNINSYGLEMGVIIPIEFPLTFGYTMAINNDVGMLRSGYRYSDGSISYAADKQLNGLFHISTPTFNVGGKLVWQTNWGDFFAKYEYYGINLAGDAVTSIYDNQDDQGASVYNNHILTNYHSDDIQWSNESDSYFVGLHSTIPNIMRGHKYTLGLTYYFGKS